MMLLKNQKIFIIVQARMGSSRLPGKTLMPIGNHSLLGWHILRLQQFAYPHYLYIATTDKPQDSAIMTECQRYHCHAFQGSATDVLKRYANLLYHLNAQDNDIIIRTTADCPLIDTRLMQQMLCDFQDNKDCDYMRIDHQHLPRGLDCEITYVKHLLFANHHTTDPYEREHVTAYLYHHQDRFHCITHHLETQYFPYRLCVDERDDLQMLRCLYDMIGDDFHHISYENIIKILDNNPDIANINKHIEQVKRNA